MRQGPKALYLSLLSAVFDSVVHMKGVLQKSFFPVLVLLVLVGSIALANEIIIEQRALVEHVGFYNEDTMVVDNATVVKGSYIYPNGSYINDTIEPDKPSPSNTPISGYHVTTLPPEIAYDFWVYAHESKAGIKAPIAPTIDPVNEPAQSPDESNLREDVIVYFKEMPASINEFAYSYGVRPIFVKGDIKMAAFETLSHGESGTSGRTEQFIVEASRDPRIESVKEDTFMFVDKKAGVRTETRVRYPEDYDRNGTIYVHNQVIVGFWKLPESLEDFGTKYGGKPINVNEGDLHTQTILYETEDIEGFIRGASKDPYVSFIELNPVVHAGDGETGVIGIGD